MHWLVIMAALAFPARAHHVLFVAPIPSASHHQLAKGIVDALLDAGHKVTWASPYPKKPESKNLRFIDLSVTKAIAEDIDMTDPKNRQAGIGFVKAFARNISETALRSQELRNALVKEKFDAVVTEWFFSDSDAGYAAVQQIPWILLSGVPIHPQLESMADEVRSIATHPLMLNDFPVPMSLWQRLVNTGLFLLMTAGFWIDFSSNQALYESAFKPLAAARGVTLPPYADAYSNVSVMLVNSHPSIVVPRALPPNVVDIAGYHIDPNPAPLPKDLQDLMDSSPQGVVYFSMGSILKSSSLPEQTQRALVKVLGSLPQTVLWKFEKELDNLPKNIHIRKWMPQPSILAHPNLKVFITHGGLLSNLEAVHYGVAQLMVPMFGDQPSNADRSVRSGFARRVDFSPDFADTLKVELEELLNNDSYRKRAKELSSLFRNRPVTPRETVSHYIELAIESKGAYHLRSPSRLYAWYERWMLDQIAVLLATACVLWWLLKKACCCLRNVLFKSDKVKRS